MLLVPKETAPLTLSTARLVALPDHHAQLQRWWFRWDRSDAQQQSTAELLRECGGVPEVVFDSGTLHIDVLYVISDVDVSTFEPPTRGA